jgi:glycosyltransferase involved in cell wall biosynthesis
MIGGFGANKYEHKIQALARKLPWVILEGSVSAQRKQEILSSCRYGIHGAEGEGFGIGVAEMVKAGCITFAPADGGPADILDHEALLYRSDDDAVEKICTVLSRPALQDSLLEHLRQQAGKFSAERFMRDLRTIVDKFLAGDSSGLKISRQAVEAAS